MAGSRKSASDRLASNWRTGRAVGGFPAVLKNLLHCIFSRGGIGRDPFRLLSVGSAAKSGTLDTATVAPVRVSTKSLTMYRGRARLWPKRYAATENSTGM